MSKKIWFVLVIVCLIGSLFLPGLFFAGDAHKGISSEVQSKRGMVVAGIYRNGSAVEFIEEGISTKERLEQAGIVDFIYMDCRRDPGLYMKSVTTMIEEDVDGVILSQPFAGQLREIDRLLEEADIPYIIADLTLNDGDDGLSKEIETSTVNVDDYAAGHMTGDWMANYTIKNGLIDNETVGLLYLSQDSLGNMMTRKEGQMNRFQEMIPYFDPNFVFEASFDGTVEDSLDKTTGIMVNALNISYWLVLATSDEGAIGAVRSLEQLGMDGKAAVVSIGGNLAVNEFKKEYSALKSSGYYASTKIGSEAADKLLKVMSGDKEASSTAFNTVIITRDNYLEYVVD